MGALFTHGCSLVISLTCQAARRCCCCVLNRKLVVGHPWRIHVTGLKTSANSQHAHSCRASLLQVQETVVQGL